MLSAHSSAAQELTDRLAQSLKLEADTAMNESRFKAALDAYERAAAIESSPILDYNRARALQGLGRHADALMYLESFSDRATPELKGRVPQLSALFATLQQRVGKLRISCNVAGAHLRVGERSLVMSAPSESLRLDDGFYQVTASAPGHSEITRTIQIPAQGVATLALELPRVDDAAFVTIASNVPGARVTVDGNTVGQTPLEMRLAAGSHLVQLRSDGYEPRDSQIVLAAREKRHLQWPLQRNTPVYARWWFWTGVGVALAAGTLTAVALKTDRAADRGDIPPGTIAAPLTGF
ncbi:MAG TPA: PEGA domain-containing protein [Polyangiaceae bacterium]|nr:PEGA domain-containing protein [Polyangiaceae bacterium]